MNRDGTADPCGESAAQVKQVHGCVQGKKARAAYPIGNRSIYILSKIIEIISDRIYNCPYRGEMRSGHVGTIVSRGRQDTRGCT